MEPITIATHTIPTTTTAATATDQHDPRHHWTRSIIPILSGFHAGYFRISLSLGSQALLWKSLMINEPTSHSPLNTQVHHIFHRLYPTAFITLWSFSLVNLVIISLVYLLRCIFLPHMVKAEFLHHVGVNYLFTPWISWLMLLQCAPGVMSRMELYLGFWWLLVVPMVVLDLKIYGRWFTTKGNKHTLTVVANPTCQMTVIGNLVGSRAVAQMGCKESAMFMFSVGMVHYLVVLVTLYQSKDALPAVLKPVFFTLFAAPAVASLAWSSIAQSFDTLAKMLFFLSLFLFMSLVGRASIFKRAMKRFNVAWWAYPFPVTVLALSATEYAKQAKDTAADVLMLVLVSLSLIATLLLVIFTIFNFRSFLFPQDDIDEDDVDDHGDYDPILLIKNTTNFPMSPSQPSDSSLRT